MVKWAGIIGGGDRLGPSIVCDPASVKMSVKLSDLFGCNDGNQDVIHE